MKKTNQHRGAMDPVRYSELKRILVERRREILGDVHTRIKHVRVEGGGGMMQTVETGDASKADIHDDIEFALIQMKTETLQRIETALGRLEDGEYGYCSECGDEIAQQRLRALPFALRCKDCEEARENRPAAPAVDVAAAGRGIALRRPLELIDRHVAAHRLRRRRSPWARRRRLSRGGSPS